jgi:hypothetical protein
VFAKFRRNGGSRARRIETIGAEADVLVERLDVETGGVHPFGGVRRQLQDDEAAVVIEQRTEALRPGPIFTIAQEEFDFRQRGVRFVLRTHGRDGDEDERGDRHARAN